MPYACPHRGARACAHTQGDTSTRACAISRSFYRSHFSMTRSGSRVHNAPNWRRHPPTLCRPLAQHTRSRSSGVALPPHRRGGNEATHARDQTNTRCHMRISHTHHVIRASPPVSGAATPGWRWFVLFCFQHASRTAVQHWRSKCKTNWGDTRETCEAQCDDPHVPPPKKKKKKKKKKENTQSTQRVPGVLARTHTHINTPTHTPG